jgi:hypothetical protein
MARLRSPALTVLSSLWFVACGPEKDTTATQATTTGTDGNSSVPGTTAGPGGNTPASEPTSTTTSTTTGPGVTTTTMNPVTSVGTAGTTDVAETDSTTGGDCIIEVPPPGSCAKGAPLQPRPSTVRSMRPKLARTMGEDEPFAASTGTTTEGDSTTCVFICEPTDVGSALECDPFAQDCPEGEKCNAFANDGGGSWNATKCVPAGPDLVGEPCTVEGSAISGIDSCVAGAMCWNVDPNNQGTCIALCTCSIANPICEVPNTTCAISNDDSLVLCLPVCDPLNPGVCGPSEVCISNPTDNLFTCVTDASGEEGQQGDPCEFVNVCDPGLFCGPEGSCSPFCALDEPACPGGQACMPWFEEGQAPQCFENLGACI